MKAADYLVFDYLILQAVKAQHVVLEFEVDNACLIPCRSPCLF